MGASALDGLTVVDASTGLAGGICALQLADAGARVIRIAWAESGKGVSGPAADIDRMIHRDKELLYLDPGSPVFAQTVKGLCASADVAVTDLTPNGDMVYESLGESNPGLICCYISPFGEYGPYADYPATELELQGITGHMAFLGELGKPPVRSGADIAGVAGAMHAFTGILSALYWREVSGRGQKLSISLAGALLSIGSHWMADFSDPDAFSGGVTHPYEVPEVGYGCADRQVMFGFFGRRADKRDPFQELCRELGLEDLLRDSFIAEHGAGYVGVGKDAQEMKPLLEQAMSRWTSSDFLDMVHRIGGRGAPILEYDDLYGDPLHPEVEASGVLFEVASEDGQPQRAVRSPWSVDPDMGRGEHAPARMVAEDVLKLLREAGVSESDIDEMRKRGWA